MEDSVKDQSSLSANKGRSSSKLRYPLRSANKSKEEKPPVAQLSNSSLASQRGRPASSVSQSVGVLDLSAKHKSAKSPRRFSIPAKSSVGPVTKPVGCITPISEARAKRSVNSQVKNDTPVSDVSKSSNRRKFSALSSASYWLSQIKLSESAAKHSISFGFFKLALEAGCEPIQRMRDELKSYARRHNFVEIGEPAKELFESYNILEHFEQLQVSEICSQVPEEGTRSSDDDVHSSSSITGTRKLEPKSLNTDAAQVSPIIESTKETNSKNNPGMRTRGSLSKNSATTRSVSGIAGRNVQKKSPKASKQESNNEKSKIKKQGKKSARDEGPTIPSSTEETLQENKENMETPQMGEMSLIEV
ncbi:uncharacterized protein LOC132286610 [Cornus florida]|uniref:uncharacterized protein LOC132286610 n=1 Tax=Cornus florida TaxID=4283 RepID=UPI002896AB7B|nr:uncharacterized protein LOC132286610 [Cornus florida]